jgi:hypothetical protein
VALRTGDHESIQGGLRGLIVAHDVTNVGSDRVQLTAMSRKAREASGCEDRRFRKLYARGC